MRWKLTVEYDGNGFSGFQRQEAHVITVQSALEKAIFDLSQEAVTCTAAGRTDAGVHARGQIVHFDLTHKDFPAKTIILGLNHHLGKNPASVLAAEKVGDDFHSRFSAKSRSYRYQILNRRGKLALDRNRFWLVPIPLNVALMQEAGNYLVGTHDFSSFRALGCQSLSPVKSISSLSFSQDGDQIFMDITAQSFLYHQVRNIIGTLVEVGKGRMRPDDIPGIIIAKDRTEAGPTAPSGGLYFMRVQY